MIAQFQLNAIIYCKYFVLASPICTQSIYHICFCIVQTIPVYDTIRKKSEEFNVDSKAE